MVKIRVLTVDPFQIDAFEHCTVENKSLLSIIPENTKTVFINSINLWALYCGAYQLSVSNCSNRVRIGIKELAVSTVLYFFAN